MADVKPADKVYQSKPLKAKDALADAAPAPTTEALVVSFMAYAGGPQKFAKMLYEEFNAASPGGIVRQRILETLMRGMAKIDADRNPLANLGHLSDEDLDRIIAEKVASVQQKRDKQDATA